MHSPHKRKEKSSKNHHAYTFHLFSSTSSLALLRSVVNGRGRRGGGAAPDAAPDGPADHLPGRERPDLLEQLRAGAAERGQQRTGNGLRGRERDRDLLVADGVVDLGPDEAAFFFERERERESFEL